MHYLPTYVKVVIEVTVVSNKKNHANSWNKNQ